MTPGFRYSLRIGTAGVTSARDRTRCYSPIDRRTSPSLCVVHNSAVLKSWLFPRTKRLDESRHVVLYHTDAAGAEMVHQKNPRRGRPSIRHGSRRNYSLSAENPPPRRPAAGVPPARAAAGVRRRREDFVGPAPVRTRPRPTVNRAARRCRRSSRPNARPAAGTACPAR
jgi:hypothetical protein